jgi:histidine ammonia-lyase
MVVVLDGETLTIDMLVRAAYDPSVRIELSPDARNRVDRARSVVDRWIAEGRVVY